MQPLFLCCLIQNLRSFVFNYQEGVKFTLWELVKIPGKYKGLVMGTDGAKLREISAQTGANVIRSYKDGEVYITLGNHDQRKNARALIGNAVVGTLSMV